MTLNNALLRNLSIVKPATKKQRMLEGTPLKHFLSSIMAEYMKRQATGVMQQVPQLGTQSSSLIEPPSISPLQNALMSTEQGGTRGAWKSEGGIPSGT